MIIDGIHIDGFGQFHNLDVESLSPAISVLYGENESGKTTFLAFVRAVIFGFPSGRSNENAYPPLAVGRHGGRIHFSLASGERYRVERYAGPKGGTVVLTSEDGNVYGEDTLQQLLGSATRELYRNIFGFSLAELQRLDALDDETAKSAVYGAGLGMRVSLPGIQAAFSAEAATLFKAGGRNPTINKAASELDDVRGKIRSRSKDVLKYDDLLCSLRAHEMRLATLRQEQEEVSAQNDRANRVLSVWNDWVEYLACAQVLEKLPAISSFPREGLSKLNGLEGHLTDVTGEIDELATKITDLEARTRSIAINEDLLRFSAEVEELQRDRAKYDSATADLPCLTQELNSARRDVNERLRQLGPDWDMSRLNAFNASIPTRETIRESHERLEASNSEVRRLRDRREHLQRSIRSAWEKVALAQLTLDQLPKPVPEDESALRERSEALRRILSLVRERMRLVEDKSNIEARIADSSAQLGILTEISSSISPGVGAWIGVLPSLIVLASAAFLWYTGHVYLFGTALALAVSAFAVFYYSRRKFSAERQSDKRRRDAQLQSVTSRKDEALERASRIDALLSTRDQSLMKECSGIEIPVPVSPTDVDQLIGDTNRQLELQRDCAVAKQRIEELTAEFNVIQEEANGVGVEFAAAEARTKAAHGEWESWLESVGLPRSVSTDGALEMLNAIGTARERVRNSVGFKERIGEIEAYLHGYSQQVRDAAAECGCAVTEAGDVGQQADCLSRLLRSETEKKRELDAGENVLAELHQRKEILVGRRQRILNEMAMLLDEAGVSSAVDFRTREGNWTKRCELEQKGAVLRKAIEKVGGVGEHGEEFMRFLRTVNLAEQKRIAAETGSRLGEIDEDISQTIERSATVKEQIRVLETETETSDLHLKAQCLVEQVSRCANRWSVYAIAEYLLAQARDRYERERQPGVIRDAITFFEPMTGGRYNRILAVPGETGFCVLDRDGNRKGDQALSAGTREQLYFAVRLGLIREFGKRQEPLPVILDDVFVNFDPIRAKAAVQATLELSRGNQVLLLTCHPETVRLVGAEDREIPVFCFDQRDAVVKSKPAENWLASHSTANG